jgi:hypothetical protein
MNNVKYIQIKNVEEWSPKDFFHYIKRKLAAQNAVYLPKIPEDFLTLGIVINRFKRAGKGKLAMLKFLNHVLENVTELKSLIMLRAMTQDYVPNKPAKQHFRGTLEKQNVELTEETKRWLQKLRKKGRKGCIEK